MAEENRITVCSNLLSKILESNKELLIELQFTNAIGRYRKEHPVLGSLIITDDLTIDASHLPNSEDAVVGVRALIRAAKGIMEIFLGSEEAEDAISIPAREFQNLHNDDIEKFDLRAWFPDLFDYSEGIDLEELRGEKETDQLAAVFSRLFTRALKVEGIGRLGIENVLGEHRFIKGLQFTGDGVKIYVLSDAEPQNILEGLSRSFESLDVPMEMAAVEIDKFGSLVEDLGILKRLYGGMLSTKVEFGIPVLDDALGNDISREYIMLLKGPKGMEKDMVSTLYTKCGLESGGEVIYICSTESPASIIRRLELVGVDAQGFLDSKKLFFIDWYSKNVERVQGVEIEGSIIKCSDDLTNVGVALDIAFRSMGSNPSRRAVVELISPASVLHDFETLLDFTTALCAKLRSNRCFSLVSVNDGMHERRELSAMQDNFDGVFHIERAVKRGVVKHSIRVVSFPGLFTSDPILISMDSRGITFGDPDANGSYQAFTGRGVERLVTGIPGLEILTGGGLPIHGSYLVLIPAGLFPSEIISQLSIDCLKKDHGLMLMVSTSPPSEFIARFEERGIHTNSLMRGDQLRIVDWHSQRNQRIMGVEDRNGVLCVSIDIMHLGVAVDQAIKQLDHERELQAVVDTLSSSLRDYDLGTVYRFAQSLRAKFNKNRITSFMILEKGTQSEKVLATMEEVFDGTLDISDVGGQLEIGILTMRDTHSDQKFRPLLKMRSGMNIDITGTIDRKEDLASASMGGAVSEDVIRSINAELNTVHQDRKILEEKAREMERMEKEFRNLIDQLQFRISHMEEERKSMTSSREEVARTLKILDDLLEELPEKTIEEFARSDKFQLYNKVLDKYLDEGDMDDGNEGSD